MGENVTAEGATAPWHALTPDETVLRLATDARTGLTAQEAAGRLVKYGPNRLPEGKKQGPLIRFLGQFNNTGSQGQEFSVYFILHFRTDGSQSDK